MAQRDIAIIGFSETPIVLRSGRSQYDLAGEAMAGALKHAGIDKSEIDGMAVSSCFSDAANPFYGPILSAYLGLELNWCQVTDLGGASASGNVARAAAAIRAGLCETVLVVAADSQSSENKQNIGAFRGEFQYPMGIMGPPGYFALISQRYNHQYGLDANALGKLAVIQRNHALMNPLACEKLKKPITVEDYLKSPMISDPIRMLDCVMVCDGASAFIMTTTERAKKMGAKKIVHPIGYGERINYLENDPTPDITEGGHRVAGPKALKQAGMEVKDVQMLQPYDDFLIALVMQMEHIGFCKAGQGCAFVNEHDLSYTGDLPLNTGGGQISAGQAGLAGGAHNLSEALRQLFGEAGERQVKRRENALVTGIGWIPYGRNWGSSTALILEAAQ
jgi:acetyl-CoA acetyltransferase